MRQHEVAYRRLLARLFAARPDGWVVKGGVALIMRLDPNRTSNDIDITYIDEAGEHGPALQALRADAAVELGDHFRFEIAPSTQPEDGRGGDRAYAVQVSAFVGPRPWAAFHVDLSLPNGSIPTEVLTEQSVLTGRDEIDLVAGIRVVKLERHIADKICAIHEVHLGRPSSRVRDLADLALIAMQSEGLMGSTLTTSPAHEVARRRALGTLAHDLPNALELDAARMVEWERVWRRLARGAPVSFTEGLRRADELASPIMSGEAAGRVWRRAAWRKADDPEDPMRP